MKNTMEIKIIFDNERLNDYFYKGWGLSYLINDSVLFDTGERGDWLIHNMETMKVDIHKIKIIVISHDHWDHTGGLEKILKINNKLKVYLCPHFNEAFKSKVKDLRPHAIEELTDWTKIGDNIYVTGEIAGVYNNEFIAEQSLVIKKKEDVSVITGCSHPGIIKILSLIKQKCLDYNLNMVFGGFHLKDNQQGEVENIILQFRQLNVLKAGPSHCSGELTKKLFLKEYKENFIDVKAGTILMI